MIASRRGHRRPLPAHPGSSRATSSASMASGLKRRPYRARQVQVLSLISERTSSSPCAYPLPALLLTRCLSNRNPPRKRSSAHGYVDAARHARYRRVLAILRRSSVKHVRTMRVLDANRAHSAEPKSARGFRPASARRTAALRLPPLTARRVAVRLSP